MAEQFYESAKKSTVHLHAHKRLSWSGSPMPSTQQSSAISTSIEQQQSSSSGVNEHTMLEMINLISSQHSELQRTVAIQAGQSNKLSDLTKQLQMLQSSIQTLSSTMANQEQTGHSKAVPKEALETVKQLYYSLDDLHQFEFLERANSPHNKAVFDVLKSKVMAEGQFTVQTVHRSIHRHFESMKRAYIERTAVGEKLEKVKGLKYRRKKISRLHRLFKRRQSFVKEKEKLLWEKLSIDYMSDESDDDQGNLVKHKLPWRSAMLDDLMDKLDKRYEKKRGTQWVLERARVIGTPSKRLPVEGCPVEFLKTFQEFSMTVLPEEGMHD